MIDNPEHRVDVVPDAALKPPLLAWIVVGNRPAPSFVFILVPRPREQERET
jgi:hypothetical protein